MKYRLSSVTYERLKPFQNMRQELPHEQIDQCDYCDSATFQTISDKDRYGFKSRYVMCESCGLIFQNPVPTAEGYNKFYAEYYRPLLTAYHGRAGFDPEDLPSEAKNYARFVAEFTSFSKVLKGTKTAVDLGGSTGIVAKQLRDHGVECLTVDLAEAELAVAEAEGLSTEFGTAESWDAKDRVYDMVLVCRTADHLRSVSRTLERIRTFLTDGGYLFWDIVDFGVLSQVRPDYRTALKMDHCYYLTDTTMRAYFKTHGFEVIASDFTRGHHRAYICRRLSDVSAPNPNPAYVSEMSNHLHRSLMTPIYPPTDMVSRVVRAVNKRLNGDDYVYI